jgi:hypothetical protein
MTVKLVYTRVNIRDSFVLALSKSLVELD